MFLWSLVGAGEVGVLRPKLGSNASIVVPDTLVRPMGTVGALALPSSEDVEATRNA